MVVCSSPLSWNACCTVYNEAWYIGTSHRALMSACDWIRGRLTLEMGCDKRGKENGGKGAQSEKRLRVEGRRECRFLLVEVVDLFDEGGPGCICRGGV